MSLIRARPNTFVVILCLMIALPIVTRNAVSTDSAALLGIYSLLALSVGLSYGQAGVLTMSQGAFASLGAYAAAISTTKFGVPPFVDILPAIAVPALVAFAVARLVTRLSPLATALLTLSIGSVIAIAIRSAEGITGGYMGLAGIPGLGPISTPAAYAWLAWAMVAATVLFYENLVHSAYGRALNVLRHDHARAMADGVDPPSLISAAFAISAAIAGAAGWLYAHYISFISPESLDTHLSITALLMAVIGGAEFVLGPILGTLVLDSLTRLLPAAELQGCYYGAVLIAILLLARRGLLGLAQTAIARLRATGNAASESVVTLSAEGSRP